MGYPGPPLQGIVRGEENQAATDPFFWQWEDQWTHKRLAIFCIVTMSIPIQIYPDGNVTIY